MSIRDPNGNVEKVDTGNWNSREKSGLELEILYQGADGIYVMRLAKTTEGTSIIEEGKKFKDWALGLSSYTRGSTSRRGEWPILFNSPDGQIRRWLNIGPGGLQGVGHWWCWGLWDGGHERLVRRQGLEWEKLQIVSRDHCFQVYCCKRNNDTFVLPITSGWGMVVS